MRESSTSLVKSGEDECICNSPTINWIANTGAIDHIVLEKNVFTNYSIVEGPHKMKTAGGGTLPVQRDGNVQLEQVGTLNGVLHVHGLPVHLLSLQQLVCDTRWRFILDEDDCF